MRTIAVLPFVRKVLDLYLYEEHFLQKQLKQNKETNDEIIKNKNTFILCCNGFEGNKVSWEVNPESLLETEVNRKVLHRATG